MDGRALLAKNLKRIRLSRRISQERLAADSGIDRAYVSEIERGQGNATIDLLDRLAGVLEVEIGELLSASAVGDETPLALPRGRRPKSS
jgi:transcriptional regulator with XRE-family HTH domain